MAKQSGGSNPNMIKLVIALSCFIVGGILIAWNQGAFDSVVAKKPPNPNKSIPAEQLEKHKARQKKLKEQVEKGEIQAPAGS